MILGVMMMSEEKSENEEKPVESFAELFESYNGHRTERVQLGERIRGKIISVGKDAIYVDTGTKIDGVVEKHELADENGNVPYKEGDEIELYVASYDGNEIRLSKAVSGAGTMNMLRDAFENSIPREGRVKGQIKGGYQVEIAERRAFCPASQIDLKPSESPDQHVGKSYLFLITQFEEGGKNIVVSRRELLKREQQKAIAGFMESLIVGAELEGRVTRVMPYGVFVEIFPGVEGLVHVSEVSWSRVEKPGEVLHTGDPLRVKVLSIEKGQKRNAVKISLSVKQMTGDPWEQMEGRYQIGEKVMGKVVRCAAFGAFVEIAEGIEGLVHLSEMSYTKRVLKPEEIVQVGENLTVVVKEIDIPRRRISLSLKDAEGDPWLDVPEKYRVGSPVNGTIERKEKFGYFIALEPGVTGLLPISKIKNSLKSGQIEKLKTGDTIALLIEEVHASERKITLGPGDSKDEEGWKEFAGGDQKKTSFFGEKLQQALQKKIDKP
jgi:small subunit ribosomal protein S1